MAIGWVQSPQPSPRPNQQRQQQSQQQAAPQAQHGPAPSTSSRQGAPGDGGPKEQEERPQNAAAQATDSSGTAAAPVSGEERSKQSSGAAHALAGSGAASGPESNMYGESVISVPPLGISDDQKEDSKAASSDDAAGASSSTQPVGRLDFSSMYSLFYRESPTAERSPQSGAAHSGQSSQTTTANPPVEKDVDKDVYTPYRDAQPPVAAAAMRPDTAHESQQRARAFGPADSASLEESPALTHDEWAPAKASPAPLQMQADPEEAPEKLKLGSASGGSDDEPPAGIRPADSWHMSADKDGRGMHVTFQASNT